MFYGRQVVNLDLGGYFLIGTFSWVLTFLELFTPFLLLVAGL
jgi:hypothetical protein